MEQGHARLVVRALLLSFCFVFVLFWYALGLNRGGAIDGFSFVGFVWFGLILV